MVRCCLLAFKRLSLIDPFYISGTIVSASEGVVSFSLILVVFPSDFDRAPYFFARITAIVILFPFPLDLT